MGQLTCPNCQRVITYMDNSGDYVHQCDSGNEALDKEDIAKIDNSGYNYNGIANKLTGRARLESPALADLNVRGLRKDTHTERQHYEYIEIGGK